MLSFLFDSILQSPTSPPPPPHLTHRQCVYSNKCSPTASVADPESRIQCLFDPWTWIWDPEMVYSGSRILDLGSWISDPGSQPHIFYSLVTNLVVKSSIYNSLKTGPIFFLQHFKTKIILNLVKFAATKKSYRYRYNNKFFFNPSFVEVFDTVSGIRDG